MYSIPYTYLRRHVIYPHLDYRAWMNTFLETYYEHTYLPVERIHFQNINNEQEGEELLTYAHSLGTPDDHDGLILIYLDQRTQV